MNDREKEHKEKQRRRLERWWKSLPKEHQKDITDDEKKKLITEGFLTESGELTPAGELRLHQLNLLKWMAEKQTGKKCTCPVKPCPMHDGPH